MYQLINDASARHIPSGTVFPLPPVESFGYDYAMWLDAGNTPDPADPPPPPAVPIEVTQRQARMALLSVGLLSTVEAAINALPDPPRTEARIAWDFSNTIQRSNPFVSQLAALLGFTESQLDELFITASGL
jgi:hypothetical protein